MYRKGAVGALLDIYEQAINELKETVIRIPDNALAIIIDKETMDENCRSVQTILSHVVNSAYGYATSIHNLTGNDLKRPDKIFHLSIQSYLEDLDKAFRFTEDIFNGIEDNELEQFDEDLKMRTGWGQLYDIEQLTEHAIVHVLRHKRQIEKIKKKLAGLQH